MLRAGQSRVRSWLGQILSLFSKTSIWFLGSTQWVLWYFSGVGRPGSEVDQSLSSRTEVKNEWSSTSTPLYPLPWRTEGSTFPTSRKEAGSFSDDVIGNFHLRNPSGHTMALRSTQPLTAGVYPGCKDGRCLGLTTLPSSYHDYFEIWEPQPPETLWACAGL